MSKSNEKLPQEKQPEKISTIRKVFFGLTIVFTLYFIPQAYCLYKFHVWSLANFKTEEEKAHVIQANEFWIPIVSGITILTIRGAFIRLLQPVFYYYCKEQNVEELRQKRSLKASECAFKFLYFSLTTIYGYYTLKDIDWFAWYLGGDGHMINGFSDMPQFTYRPGVKMYSLVTMGYHVMDLFHHIFIKERSNDYEEMLLHHTCTVILYSQCLGVNNFVTGCPIMFLHDITDIFIGFSRMIAETKASFLAAPFFTLNMVMWFYFRSVCFPHIIYTLHTNWVFDESLAIEGQAIRWSVTVFLSCLAVLHVYWLYLFFAIILHYAKTGQAEDKINKTKLNKKEQAAQDKKQS